MVRVFLAVLAAAAPLAVAADDPVRPADLRLHAGFLLSPELAGRRPGSDALSVAAAYAAAALERAGWAPVRSGGRAPRFPVPFAESAAGTRLAVAGGEAPGSGPEVRTLPFSAEGACAGPLHFAGYGLDPGAAGSAGRVVVVVAGAPPGAAARRSLRQVAADGARGGAAAVLVALDPRTDTFDHVVFADGRREEGRIQDRGFEFLFVPRIGERPRRLRKEDVTGIFLAVPPGPPGAEGAAPAGEKPLGVPVLGISCRAAERLLGTGLAATLDRLDVEGGAPPVPGEGAVVGVRAALLRTTVEVPVVLARFDGTDHARDGDPVAVTARLDGDGDGGAALALAFADAFARGGRARRPVLLVLGVEAEDCGLDLPGLIARRAVPSPKDGAERILTLSAAGRVPAIVSPEGPAFEEARRAAAAIRLRSPLAPGEAGGGRRLRVPVLPGPDEGEDPAEALDAVRLAVHLVRDEADAGPRAKPEAPAPPAPAAPPAPEPTLARARAARHAGDLGTARAAIEGALDAEPGRIDLYLERGRIRLAAGERDAALLDADHIERLTAGDSRAWLLRFEARASAGDVAEADAALARAAVGGLPEAMLVRGLWMLEGPGGNRPEAERNLGAAVAADGGGAFGLTAAGVLAILRGDPEAAEGAFTRAVAADGECGPAFYWRGRLGVMVDGDPARAEADFTRAEALGTERDRSRFNRGLCRLRLGKYSAAIADFMDCIRAGTSLPESTYNVACAHARMGDRREALDWLGRAVLAGFRDAEHARGDPDLLSIRDDPLFEAILRSERTD